MATARKNLGRLLARNAYPGRGIVVGKTADRRRAVFAYFIMGRSENSRNRVFREYGAELRTEPFDEKKLVDPSLIIYSPVKVHQNHVIVTNGDQTDTVEASLKAGHCFRHALMQRTFEPDAPNFTPRISAILHLGKGRADYTYELAIVKCADGKGKKCDRQFFVYEPVSGAGHFLHTYRGNGDPLPSFAGEPVRVKIGNDLRAFAEEIWSGLNESNKISLYCRAIDLTTGAVESVIYNKNH